MLWKLRSWAPVWGLAVGLIPAAMGHAQEAIAQPGDDALQVLDQGPVHEAFAEPVQLAAGQAVVIERQPPEPINELPPDVRPEGDNVEWIPGYWWWTDQQQDFIWVSGVWRDIPPGRRWVPGHWTGVDGGFSWTPGFWAGEQVQEIEILPLPPDSLEVGPSSPAPAANYFWIPGCWTWRNETYVWRTGYWYVGQPNWIWVPDHYCYTPAGAIFVNGFWDYPLASRGLLYAPVWWSRPIYSRPGYFYRPRSIVNTALLLTALFVNQNHHHYYYGYGGWRNDFYRPWWQYGYHRGGRWNVYDPFFAYHRWYDGRNRDDWVDNVRRDFDRHQQNFVNIGRIGDNVVNNTQINQRIVVNVNNVINNRNVDLPVRIREVSEAERLLVDRQLENWQEVRELRRQTVSALADRRGNQPADRVLDLDGNAGPGDGPQLGDAAGDLADNAGSQAGDRGPRPGGRPGRGNVAGGPRGSFRLPPAIGGLSDSGGQAAGGGQTAGGGQASAGGGQANLNANGPGRGRGRANVIIPGAGNPDGAADRPDFRAAGRGDFRNQLGNGQTGANNRRARLPGENQLGAGNPGEAADPGDQGPTSGGNIQGGGRARVGDLPGNLERRFRNELPSGPGGGQARGRAGGVLDNTGPNNGPPADAGGQPAGGRPQFRPRPGGIGGNQGSEPGGQTEPRGQGAPRFRVDSGGSNADSSGGPPAIQRGPQVQPRNFRPQGDGGPSRQFNLPQGAGQFRNAQPRVIEQPDAGQRSFRLPQGGGEPRSFRVPEGVQPRSLRLPQGGGEPRSFRVPSGGDGGNFRVPSGGGESRSFRPGGGQPNVRSFPGGGGGGQPNVRSFEGGGRPAVRGNFEGGSGGGRAQFQGGGGGGRGQFQGGGGGGGGGGRGRGRDRD